MSDETGRRQFVKTLTVAGAAAVAGGVVGYVVGKGGPKAEPAPEPAPEPKSASAAVSIDKDGFVVIENPDIAAIMSKVYQAQEEAVRLGNARQRGLRLRIRQIAKTPPINVLCEPRNECGPMTPLPCYPDSTRTR